MSDRAKDQPKSVRAVRFFAGFFSLAGIAALVVGAHDATLHGSGLGVLFPGLLLLLAGGVFIGAAWKLIRAARSPKEHEKRSLSCEPPVPLAFLVSILLGVYVFFGALAGTGPQRAIVITVSVAFMAAGAVGLGLFWGDIEVSVVRVGATVALTVTGLLVGVWEFWYQNAYVPSHLDRAVSVQVSLKKLRTQGRYDLLSATFGYQDIGSRAVVVLGSVYTLTGSTVIACPRSETPKRERPLFKGQLPDPQRSRFMYPVWEIQPATILAAGTFAPQGRRLAPSAPASRQLILYVPHNRYQLLRLRAQVLAISASVPLAAKPPVPKNTGDQDIYSLWQLRDGGWFQSLLSGSRGWIVTRYEIVNPESKANHDNADPDLRVIAKFPNSTWSGNQPNAAQIRKLFPPNRPPPLSETETFADAELPVVAPVARPTAKELKQASKSCKPGQAPTKRMSSTGR